MFLQNRSRLPVALARGHVTDDVAVASVNLESAYGPRSGRLDPALLPAERGDGDPPDILRLPFWRGVSLTVAGTVQGPGHAPHVRHVSITAGAVQHRLAVFGSRRWRRVHPLGALEPSEPEPFDTLPLTWAHAFGGAFVMAAGLLPGTDLPHPGGRFGYPLNENGVGFYPDERSAVDQPLPRIERVEELVQRWSDRPEPGGFAPCPELAGLRLFHGARRQGASLLDPAEARRPCLRPEDIHLALLVMHHAPPRLVLDEVDAGTPISVDGLSALPIRFELPPSPMRVAVRVGRTEEPVQGRVRSVHLDADRGLLRVVHGHLFRYPPSRPPSWVLVDRPS
jgi:hypothetical protein